MIPETDKAAEDSLEDIPAEMRPVVERYGRAMYALVMNAGMAGQAVAVLGQIAERSRDQQMAHALGVLAAGFNQIANAYIELKQWDEGMIAQCDRDIQLAFKGRIVVPGRDIVLDA